MNYFFKNGLIILLIFFTTIIFGKKQKINIKGFGEVSVTRKKRNIYIIDLGKYGKFTASGKLKPLNFQIKTTLKDLKQFPGYKLYKKLDLKEIKIGISKNGLKIEAILDTKRNFGNLLKMFKIPNPTMGITVEVSKKRFKFSGELDFEKKPIVINLIPNFSRFTLEKLEIEAEAAAGEGDVDLSLGFSIQSRYKPTKWDPDIQSVTSFSYNLTSNEISASISMTDTWSNPLFLSKFLKPNSIVFSDVAVSLDWPIGSPTPSGFGFNIGKAKFFHLEFSAQLALTPLDKKVAFYAKANQITMNDFTKILREGFGLKVPDIFPKDIYIKDIEILFSPNGGEIGEFKIKKGFLFKGKAKFMDAIEAEINFQVNSNDGFYLYYNMDSSFKEYFKKVFKKHPKLKYISGELLRTFNVKKVMLEAKADKKLNLSAKTECEFELLGKNFKFKIEGSFSPKKIKDKIFKEIEKVALPHVSKVLDKVEKNVAKAGKAAIAVVGVSSNLVKKYVKLGLTKSKHVHFGKGGEKYCRRHCIPNRANHLVNKVLPNSLRSIQNFYNKVILDLMDIEGENSIETKRLRLEKFGAEWNRINRKIEKSWDSILQDKEYVGYFVSRKWATHGGKLFRRKIRERKKEYDKLKRDLYNLLVSKTAVTIKYNRSAGCGTLYYGDKRLKKHCGWRKNWHTILRVGCIKPKIEDRVLFYDKNRGEIEIYKVDNYGNMSHLKSHKNISKNWKSIKWIPKSDCNGIIKFTEGDGHVLEYGIDNRGNFKNLRKNRKYKKPIKERKPVKPVKDKKLKKKFAF